MRWTMNFTRAHNQYLTPPDEPEAVLCNDCGEEMENGETCKNQYCPAKFEGVAAEMANELVEALAEVKTLKAKVKRLEMNRK
jgi:hypothetical protein